MEEFELCMPESKIPFSITLWLGQSQSTPLHWNKAQLSETYDNTSNDSLTSFNESFQSFRRASLGAIDNNSSSHCLQRSNSLKNKMTQCKKSSSARFPKQSFHNTGRNKTMGTNFKTVSPLTWCRFFAGHV